MQVKTNHERLFYQIAGIHVEVEGEALRGELETESTPAPIPGLDKRLRGSLFRLKYKVHIRAAGLIAACLALALLLPGVLQRQGMGPMATAPVPVPEPQMDMAMPAAPAPAAGDIRVNEESEIMSEAPIWQERNVFDPRPESVWLEDGAFPGDYDAPALPYWLEQNHNLIPRPEPIGERIPLNFTPPDGFNVFSSGQINYETIYNFEKNRETVGLHMAYVEVLTTLGLTPEDYIFEWWATMELGGHTVYYLASATRFGTIRFVKDDILYSLHGASMENLIILAEAIIGS